MLSEQEYCDNLFENIKGRRGLCVFNYYQREMEDAEKFIAWSDATGRLCVFEPDAAYIVWKFFGIEPFVYLPDKMCIRDRYSVCTGQPGRIAGDRRP